jgi:predicted nicotinamide N-methyase
VLDHPDTVRDRHVLDIASGPGLVGIAAVKAGATEVTVADIDAFAIAAAELNADSNRVTLTLCCKDVLDTQPNDRWQTILAGDIFYERDTAARAFAFLADHARAGATILIGDPKLVYHFPIPVGEMTIGSLVHQGWIEIRGEDQRAEARLTEAGLEAMRSRV